MLHHTGIFVFSPNVPVYYRSGQGSNTGTWFPSSCGCWAQHFGVSKAPYLDKGWPAFGRSTELEARRRVVRKLLIQPPGILKNRVLQYCNTPVPHYFVARALFFFFFFFFQNNIIMLSRWPIEPAKPAGCGRLLPRLLLLALSIVARCSAAAATPAQMLAPAAAAAASPPPPLVATAWPDSMVLPALSSSVQLAVNTSAPSACVWAIAGAPAPAQPGGGWQPFATGNGTTAHTAVLEPVSADASARSNFTVRCAASNVNDGDGKRPAGAAAGGDNGGDDTNATQIDLVYRCLPDIDGANGTNGSSWGFPRTGNLWGSWNFASNLTEAARRVDMWLGAVWTDAQVAELRQRNAHTLMLGSVNAVEGDNDTASPATPERYFLHNCSGASTLGPADRLIPWPGAARMDLTRPEVAECVQARMRACVRSCVQALMPRWATMAVIVAVFFVFFCSATAARFFLHR